MQESVARIFKGRGGKSGGEVRTPVEAKNTLQSRAYVRFVDLISEGPIEGFCNDKGVTVEDARYLGTLEVDSKGRITFDPTKYDVEGEGTAITDPFNVYGIVSTDDPLQNTPLFSSSVGYAFSGVENNTIRLHITASFYEVTKNSNNESVTTTVANPSDLKSHADVFLLTYPQTEAQQLLTARRLSKTGHGFSVGDIIYRQRTATNTYTWAKIPDGLNLFAYQVRQVSLVVNTDVFEATVYPICPEGRVRALRFTSRGQNYIGSNPIINPVTQTLHGFNIGDMIDWDVTLLKWFKATRYTQTVATVTDVLGNDTFTAVRQVFDGPKLNVASVVGTAVFFDDIPLVDPNTLAFNFVNVRLDYRLGESTQPPLLGFEQTETLISTEQSPDITRLVGGSVGPPAFIKQLPTGDWDELVINLILPYGLYRRDPVNGDIYALGDNYGILGLPSSTTAVPENQPPVIRITYQLYSVAPGSAEANAIGPEKPFGINDGYVVIRGKTMSSYEFSVRGSLGGGNSDTGTRFWQLKFYRMVPDDSSYTNGTLRQSVVRVNSITGVINAKMVYPFCAVVGVEIDAEQFSHIPVRGYQVKLMKIQVPTNYFPPYSKRVRIIQGVTFTDYRTHAEYNRLPSGDGVYDDVGDPVDQIWDGTFYDSWTDNPAWITHHVSTDTRTGFGSHILAANKWLFYKIGRYCDELIDTSWDGTKFTSKEPRFSCSCYFQTTDEAWRVLSDIASSFSGFLFYQSGTMIPVQDCPRTSRFSFGPSNVENGLFSYTGVHKNNRFSTIVAKFSDPANRYRLTPVLHQDDELMGRIGWKLMEKTAFGVTSRFQAERFAKRLLLSSKYLTTTVRFTTGLLGSVLRPGDVIEVYDPGRSSLPFSGRITAINHTVDDRVSVTLDRFISSEQLAITNEELFDTYGLVCQRPLAVPQASEITDAASLLAYMDQQITAPLPISSIGRAPNGNTVLMLKVALPVDVEVGGVWGLRRSDVQPQLFQVISVEESTKHKFAVVAAEYQPALYDAIDHDATFTELPVNPDLTAWKRPNPVRNLIIGYTPRVTDDGQKVYMITISWSPPDGGFAREYLVEWKRGLGDYQTLTTTKLTFAETIVVEPDNYCARVRTIGITGFKSSPVEACTLIGVQTADNQEIVSGLEIIGQANDTVFTTSDVTFDWRVNWSGASTEFHTEPAPVLAPTISDYEVVLYDTAMGQLYAASPRTTGFSVSLSMNQSLRGGPYREFIIGVRARTAGGSLSKQTLLRVKNNRPPVPTFTHEADPNGYLMLKFDPQTYPDFHHFNVWVSHTNGFEPSDATLVYSGSGTVASVAIDIGVISYVRVAAVDTLANSILDCEISNQFSVVGKRVGALTVFDFINPGWNV